MIRTIIATCVLAGCATAFAPQQDVLVPAPEGSPEKQVKPLPPGFRPKDQGHAAKSSTSTKSKQKKESKMRQS